MGPDAARLMSSYGRPETPKHPSLPCTPLSTASNKLMRSLQA